MSCNTCLDSNFYNQKATYYLEEFNIPVNVSKQILKVLYTSLDSCGLDCCNGTFVGGSMLSFQDEGSTLTGNTDNINFVGDGVVATKSGNTITVTISNNSSNSLTDGTYGDIIVSNGTLTWTVADGSITNSKLANGAVTANKLAQMGATNGQVLKWNGTQWAPGTDLEGVTGSTGVTQILAGTNIGISPVNGTGVVTINNTGPVGEINIGANVGLGEGNVYKNKTGTTLNFKKLHAGSGISITDGTDIVTIATTDDGGGGGSVTSVNVSGGTTGLSTSGGPITLAGTITLGGTLAATHGGTGWSAYSIGDILYADTATTLARRAIGSTGQVMVVVGNSPVWITPPWITNIIAGSGISVTPAGSVVTIAATAVSGGSGEANTGSNVGAGAGVFAQKSGVDLQFKSIVAGSNISIVTGATTITINGTGVSGTTGGWDLNGNAGTVAGTNFIGTTDDVDVVFKRNNTNSGRIANNLTSYGYYSSSNNTTVGTTAIGRFALTSNTGGTGNTAIGHQTLRNNTEGHNNLAVGENALYSNITGIANTAIGGQTLNYNTTGSYNTAIGRTALYSNTTVSNLVAVGYQALYSNTTGTENTAVGYESLKDNTTGNSNTAIGYNALNANTTASYNTAIGTEALFSNTTGIFNTANGYQALYSNTIGVSNTANGNRSLYSNTTGINNVAYGSGTLYSNTTGNNNTANGPGALRYNTTGNFNTANGVNALYYNTTGEYNTANGGFALQNNTIGYQNTANGKDALYSNTIGYQNTANGYQSLYSNTTGNVNTANGAGALQNNTTGYYNTANGDGALISNTTGNSNTGLGHYSNVATSNLTYATAIGAEAIVSTDNTIKLGRSTEDSVVIGQNGAVSSAKLAVTSTTQGFLPPRMTAAQKNAISSPEEGLLVYQSDGTKGWYGYDGSSWIQL